MDNFLILFITLLANINLITGNNGSTREICSKLTIKTPERRLWRLWRRSGFFILNFEHILHLFPVFLLLTDFSEFSQLKARNFIKTVSWEVFENFTIVLFETPTGCRLGLLEYFLGYSEYVLQAGHELLLQNIKNNLSSKL